MVAPGDETAPAQPRDPSIDALRVIAALACIGLHSVIPYTSREVGELAWSVRDTTRSVAADFLFWWGRAAQVQTFFFIAGVLSAQMMAARGARAYAMGRLQRLGVPLAAAVAFVLPVVAAIWAWGWVVSGRASWAEVWAWRFSDPVIQRNALGPAHLWFLQDLLIISVAFAWVAPQARSRGSSQLWSRSAVVLTALALAGAMLLTVRPEILFELRNTFVPDPFRLAYDTTFFAGGVWLGTHRRAPARWPQAMLFLTSAAGVVGLVTYLAAGLPLYGSNRLAIACAASAASWLTLLGALRLVDETPLPAIGRRFAAASYPIYLIHLPIVGVTQVLLFSRDWSVAAKVACVFLAGVAVSWLLAGAGAAAAARVRTSAVRIGATVPLGVWTAAAIAAGVAIRVVHYLRNPDVWHDEAALLVNVVERGYAGLLAPLTFNEAAPPLFLWVQHWLAVHLSDGTWVMRLLPFAASCAALVVVLPLTRAIRPAMAPIAVLLMACSARLVFHSVEAKPYALDVLFAAAVGSTFVLTNGWRTSRRLVLFAVAAPLLVWASYPGVFLVGGVACALLPVLRRERRPAGWVALAVLCVIVAVSFALLLAGPVRAQRTAPLLGDWEWAFPAGLSPVAIAVWLVRSAIGIADYCFRPFGGVLLIPIGVGIAALWRRDRVLVLALVVPIALAAAAGLVRQYPFNGSRVMVYTLPALSILAAEGLGVMITRLRAHSTLAPATVMAIAILPPVLLCARDIVFHLQRPETATAAEVVLAARRPGEMVASGQWEYRYYFRGLGQDYVRLEEQPLPIGQQRLWYVVHGPTVENRRAAGEAVAADRYRVVSTLDLGSVSVFELGAVR